VKQLHSRQWSFLYDIITTIFLPPKSREAATFTQVRLTFATAPQIIIRALQAPYNYRSNLITPGTGRKQPTNRVVDFGPWTILESEPFRILAAPSYITYIISKLSIGTPCCAYPHSGLCWSSSRKLDVKHTQRTEWLPLVRCYSTSEILSRFLIIDIYHGSDLLLDSDPSIGTSLCVSMLLGLF
jgi:hypothetical protein